VDLWFSYATPSLNVPADTSIHDCREWLRIIYFSDSYTRDTDGNGKIDIIEVVVPVNLDDDFTNFQVDVDGYTVTNIDTGGTGNDRLFWIHLEEKPYLDTDIRPVWYMINSGQLRDDATNSYQVEHEPPKGIGNPEVPWDDADPVVGYTLAQVGKNEIFIAFSESVYGSGPGGLLQPGVDISYSGAASVSSISIITGIEGGRELLLALDIPVTAADIVGGVPFVFSNIHDNAPGPIPDVSPSLGGLLPVSPNLLLSRGVYGDPVPPANQSHRVSDLGLGIIEPVYARNTATLRDPERGAGVGLINMFDGSEWLQPQNMELQANYSAGTAPDIWFDINIPDRFISEDNPGLWLPDFDEADFSGLVPYPNDPGASLPAGYTSTNPDSLGGIAAAPLITYTIPDGNAKLRDDSTFDFFFFADNLYHARVDNPAASDWYRRIRPFSFKLREVRAQAGDVSILNNVINPDRGEKTTIHYNLSRSGTITIQVFNLAGDLVEILYRGRRTAGEYAVSWDGRNRAGNAVGRGIYFVRFTGPGLDEYRKVMVVR
jgi:hypothetical protein